MERKHRARENENERDYEEEFKDKILAWNAAHRGQEWWKTKKFISWAGTIFMLLVVSLVVWGVIRPTKPGFVLLEATIFGLSVSETNLVTSNFEVTVRYSNPNSHFGIYYVSLVVYASFQDQQITLPTAIRPTFQEGNGVNIWSELVSGESVPIATFTAAALEEDQTIWNSPIIFNFDGFVSWRMHAYTTKTYHIQVTCKTNVPIGNPIGNNVVKYQLDQSCTVSV